MRIKDIFSVCFFIFFAGAGLRAQYPYYKNYTINDGLVSNKIYNIIEDRLGFIWICTERGVSRFDGVSFVSFTTKDGLPDNEVLNLFEDGKGRIWFNGFSTEPCYYLNGKIYNSHNDSFLKRIKMHKPKGTCLSIIVQHINAIAFYVVQDGKRLMICKDMKDVEFKSDDQRFLSFLYQYILIKKKDFSDFYSPVAKQRWFKNDSVLVLNTQDIHFPRRFNYTVAPDNYLYWLDIQTNSIKQIDLSTDRPKEFKLDVKYHNIFVNNDVVALTADSFYTIYNRDFSKQIESVKLPFNYERIHVDRKGNKWFGSFDNGMYLIRKNPPVAITMPVNKEKGILTIWASGDNLFIGTEKNGLLSVDSTGDFKVIINRPGMNRVRGFCYLADKYVLGFDNGVFIADKNFTNLKLLNVLSVKDIEIGGENEVLIGFSGQSASLQLNLKDSVVSVDKARTTAICRFNESEIWMGGMNGVRKCVKTGNQYVSSDLKLNELIDDSRIVDIQRDKYGNMWVATDQEGLFFCSISGNIIHFTEDSANRYQLLSDLCIELNVAADNSIWLATANGMSVIRYANGDFPNFYVYNYSLPDGLPGKMINSLTFWGNKTVLATTNGLFYYKRLPQSLNETSETIITQVKVNSEIYNPANLILPYNRNNLIISYASSFINTGLSYKFKYRIRPLNNNWIYTNTLEVPLLGLESGDYSFEIAAVNMHGESGKIASLIFTIQTPWFRQWWFIGTIGLIVIVSGIYFYRLFRERVTLSKNLTLFRLRILRAQMNPHFVFNALSNIKYLIQIRQTDNAEGYISTLSQIMRKSIDYSGKEFIQLDKEIQYTKDYLEIEKLRFGEKFEVDFKTELNEEETEAIFVPPLILQPLVENSIKHAFKGINYKGTLSISITKHNKESLRFVIEDNGKGFDIGMEMPPNHGLSITRERLTILYKYMKKAGEFKLHSEVGKGTRIIIDLPILKD